MFKKSFIKNNENKVTSSYAVLVKDLTNMEPIWGCFLMFVVERLSIILVSNPPNSRPKRQIDPEFWRARWTKSIWAAAKNLLCDQICLMSIMSISLFDNIFPRIYLVFGVRAKVKILQFPANLPTSQNYFSSPKIHVVAHSIWPHPYCQANYTGFMSPKIST